MQTDPALFTDTSALTHLKKGAREKDPETIKKVAKQFESLFVQMMLKSMRETVSENELFGSKNEKMYQDMYDKQLSLQISNGRGIGLAKAIERQLGGTPEVELEAKKISDYLANPRPVDETIRSNVTLSKLQVEFENVKVVKAEKISSGAWVSAKQFVNDVWPHALRAADALGVDADILIAQSALETGWGKHLPLKPDGSNSFNLFGIKADQRWQGDKVEITTREYRHGVMQHEKANFRSYDSISEAFDDYAKFISDNPRYQQALEHGYSAKAYTHELQKAGYATDPDYAEKINRVRSNDMLQSELKKIKEVPLT